MTHTNPAIFSHRLEGFGIPTNQAGASDSVMIPSNPARQAHAEGSAAPGECRSRRVRHTQRAERADSPLVCVIRPTP
jgi:hypothetical protein